MSARGAALQDFVISGVGGQGGLLTTRVLAQVLLRGGTEVKTSEVHGMSQRGGSVLSFVRRGREVLAPLSGPGAADAVLGLELLEAARALPLLKPGGLVVASTQRVVPAPVAAGQAVYPDDLGARLRAVAGRVVLVPAAEIAARLGNPRVANLVCLGALSTFLELPRAVWAEVIEVSVPPRTVALNLAAFDDGAALAER